MLLAEISVCTFLSMKILWLATLQLGLLSAYITTGGKNLPACVDFVLQQIRKRIY